MPVPSQGHYGFHSFPVVDWFCLFIYLWVLTFPLLYCSKFGNFVITLIDTTTLPETRTHDLPNSKRIRSQFNHRGDINNILLTLRLFQNYFPPFLYDFANELNQTDCYPSYEKRLKIKVNCLILLQKLLCEY